MLGLLIVLFTVIAAAAQTPAEQAQSLNTQGNLVADGGNLGKAQRLYREAIRIWRSLGPDYEAHTAGTLMNLAVAMTDLGERAAATKIFEEALALHRRTLGDKHHRTVALGITIQAAGEDSMDTALAYSSVAEAHRAMGSGVRTRPLYRKARAIYEKALGPDHPRVASLYSQEGLILMQEGRFALAEQSMTHAVKSLELACPGCVAEMWVAENNLGLLRLQQKRYRDADAAFTRAMEVREKLAGANGPELADILQSLAVVREKERLFEDAVRLMPAPGRTDDRFLSSVTSCQVFMPRQPTPAG